MSFALAKNIPTQMFVFVLGDDGTMTEKQKEVMQKQKEVMQKVEKEIEKANELQEEKNRERLGKAEERIDNSDRKLTGKTLENLQNNLGFDIAAGKNRSSSFDATAQDLGKMKTLSQPGSPNNSPVPSPKPSRKNSFAGDGSDPKDMVTDLRQKALATKIQNIWREYQKKKRNNGEKAEAAGRIQRMWRA